MKKTIFISFMILLVAVALVFVSCENGTRMGDGQSGINYYIYPYLKFKIASNSLYYYAYVVEGAPLIEVRVPGKYDFVNTTDGAPVAVFKGFENSEDARNLERLYLDSNIIEVTSLKGADKLQAVIITGEINEESQWPSLPTDLTLEGYYFRGWKISENTIITGSERILINEDERIATPVFVSLTHKEPSPATCTEAGNLEYWYLVDKDLEVYFTDANSENSVRKTDITLAPLGHSLVKHEASAATCQKTGNIEYWQCDRCFLLFSDENGQNEIKLADTIVGRTDHSYSDDWSFNTGKHWHECIWCGAIDEETKAAHVFGTWTTGTDSEGRAIKSATCSECGYILTQDDYSDRPDDDFNVIRTVAATCTERGYDVCEEKATGIEVKRNYTDALGHDISDANMVERVEATCTEDGNILYYICARCGERVLNAETIVELTDEDIVIKALGHDLSEIWFYDDNQHYKICRRCGARTEFGEHKYSEVVENVEYLASASNCQHPMLYRYSCICGKAGEELFESGDKGDHVFEVVRSKDDEKHVYYCKYCDAQGDEEDHSFEQTSTSTVCKICGHEVTYSIGGFSPKFVDKVPRGHIEYVFDRATKSYTFTFIDDRAGDDDNEIVKVEWTLNEVLQEAWTNSYTFTFVVEHPQTQKVYCVYTNSYGYRGSDTRVVDWNGNN